MLWIKVSEDAESWHIVDEAEEDSSFFKTLCGHETAEDIVEDRPGHEKTCESCLRKAVQD